MRNEIDVLRAATRSDTASSTLGPLFLDSKQLTILSFCLYQKDKVQKQEHIIFSSLLQILPQTSYPVLSGRKLPTIRPGTPYSSRTTVNVKQHLFSGRSPDRDFVLDALGFFKEHPVKIAFWAGSKAIAVNFSQ